MSGIVVNNRKQLGGQSNSTADSVLPCTQPTWFCPWHPIWTPNVAQRKKKGSFFVLMGIADRPGKAHKIGTHSPSPTLCLQKLKLTWAQ